MFGKSVKFLFLLIVLLATICMFTACGGGGDVQTDSTGTTDINPDEVSEADKNGGTLNIGWVAPPHLDPDRTTDENTGHLLQLVLEGLYSLDGNMQPAPQLADSVEITEDGTLYTFKIREGIVFHNGDTMDIDDVVASFDYWTKVNSTGVARVEDGTILDFGSLDNIHFFIKTSTATATFLGAMSNPQGGMQMLIRPKEVVEKALSDSVTAEPIGTGPYKITEYVADQHCLVTRFDEYVPGSGESSGWVGARNSYADDIDFHFITEETTKISGIKAGSLDYAGDVSLDQCAILSSDPKIQLYITNGRTSPYIVFNKAIYPFNDIRARQAANFAMNIQEIADATIGNPDLWEFDPSILGSHTAFHTEGCGEGIYNVFDPEKAKDLLIEINYDGTPIVMVQPRDGTMEMAFMTVFKQQLEAVGFVVDLQAYDRATCDEIRNGKDGWHMHCTLFGNSYYDPQVFQSWVGTNGWIGNWDDEYSHKMDEIYIRMAVEMDPEKRMKIISEWNNEFFNSLPYLKLMNYNKLFVLSPDLQNFNFNCDIHFEDWWLLNK